MDHPPVNIFVQKKKGTSRKIHSTESETRNYTFFLALSAAMRRDRYEPLAITQLIAVIIVSEKRTTYYTSRKARL
jgi:hypothetical protein